MAYNITVKISTELILSSSSAVDLKKRYMGLVVWLSENLQRDRDYAWSIETRFIPALDNVSVGWDIPKYLWLNNEEDLLALKLKFLT
jgi:hypothetical protein